MYTKKLFTNEINLENMQLTPNFLKLNENVNIQLGNRQISMENLFEKLAYLEKIEETCGKNFEKCRTISNDELKKQANLQNEILRNLKKLRIESSELMRKRRS